MPNTEALLRINPHEHAKNPRRASLSTEGSQKKPYFSAADFSGGENTKFSAKTKEVRQCRTSFAYGRCSSEHRAFVNYFSRAP